MTILSPSGASGGLWAYVGELKGTTVGQYPHWQRRQPGQWPLPPLGLPDAGDSGGLWGFVEGADRTMLQRTGLPESLEFISLSPAQLTGHWLVLSYLLSRRQD